jgi:REP element-mobilizing transposase RayT
MARPPRVEVPGAVYHVTARGNERRALFRDDTDRDEYLDRISGARQRFRFELLAYCLMTNHVHLAIRPGPEPLSRIIGRLHSTYAGWFNRRHDRAGHLFQDRYKAFFVRDDRHLRALVRYIHRNPVEARIARRAADYPWSSDRYLRRARGPDWLDVDSLLALLDESRRSAVTQYVKLVDGPDDQPTEDLDLPVDDSRSPPQVRAPAPTEPDPVVSEIPLDDLLETVARDGGLTLEDLRGRQRGGEIAAARCRAAYLARRLFRIPIRRVAMRLGRDDSSFARPLAQLESRLELDPALQATIDRLTRLLRTAATSQIRNQD